MAIVKSYSVGNGDMFSIRHNSDNFTQIDCCLCAGTSAEHIADLKEQSKGKGVTRFISTHPDQDHLHGIELLDAEMPIRNFYVVKNQATKSDETDSFKHYCSLRDDFDKAFYISEGVTRKWMNVGDATRDTSGVQILWPDTSNAMYQEALAEATAGNSYNNMSAVIRYSLQNGASFMWLGDLETDFMESIVDDIVLEKTTIVFASHHGRKTGKIPDSWLKKLDPQIIVIGEAPSRHLHYYTSYSKITQNKAGDITMECLSDKVHIYVSNPDYDLHKDFDDEGKSTYDNYIGSITVETEYTIKGQAA